MNVLALLLILASAGSSGPQPRERAAALQLAQQELAAGRRVEARRILADTAERFHSVHALLLLSRVQSEDGDAGGALESLRKARTMAPNSEEVLSAFAQMSIAAGAPVPAIVALDALRRICPGVMEYHYLIGIALLRVGDRLNAVDALRAAEQLEPHRALTLIALGMAHNSLQQYAEAKAVLVRAVELDSQSPDALAALAEAEHGLGELAAASKHAQQVLTNAPQHATANLVSGLVAMDQTRYADARAALERAVATDPLLFKASYQLSLACSRLGDEPAARKHLEIYRQTLRDVQNRIDELRVATGPMGTDTIRR